MALDTPSELRSAFNWGTPFYRVYPGPEDGSVTNADGQHLWGLFSGITAATPAVFKFFVAAANVFTTPARDELFSAATRNSVFGAPTRQTIFTSD